jgi:hypothetical protein
MLDLLFLEVSWSSKMQTMNVILTYLSKVLR